MIRPLPAVALALLASLAAVAHVPSAAAVPVPCPPLPGPDAVAQAAEGACSDVASCLRDHNDCIGPNPPGAQPRPLPPPMIDCADLHGPGPVDPILQYEYATCAALGDCIGDDDGDTDSCLAPPPDLLPPL
jgi:hypothetical protein